MGLVVERVEERREGANVAAGVVDHRRIERRALEAEHLGADIRRLSGRAEDLVRGNGQPLVERELRARIAGVVQRLAGKRHVRDGVARREVAVVREEVERQLLLLREGEEVVEALHAVVHVLVALLGRRGEETVAAAAVAADLQVRELRLEVARRHGVQLAELRELAAPLLVLDGILPVVRLVPDLPVGDLPFEAVRPALGVVADHVLADARPLRVVRRWIDVVRLLLAVVLDRDAEAEPRLHVVREKRLQQPVRVVEVVARGVVLVRVEVPEDVRDVDHVRTVDADIVQTRIRHARLLQMTEQLKATNPQYRRLPDRVHRLDRPHVLPEIDVDLNCKQLHGAHRRRQNQVHSSKLFHAPYSTIIPRIGQMSTNRRFYPVVLNSFLPNSDIITASIGKK